MFSELSERLTGTLRRLSGRGVLTEADVTDGLREIRRVLLEADVSFDVSRSFVERIHPKAIGLTRLKSVSPGQQLVKLVHDELVTLLGGEARGLDFQSVGPTVVLLVGLQGSGKTTTAAKLAARLKREQKAPFVVAADVYRPAAREQLTALAEKVGVPVWPEASSDRSSDVVELVRDALRQAEAARARTVLVDTAGRLQIDDALMDELQRLRAEFAPAEVLLVADGMTGQDAVRIARGFHEGVGVTGVILTKMDGDARGGAALSIFGAIGAPIKYVGVGEGVDALETFDPSRMAGRILARGDVVALVERAEATVDGEAAERLARKVQSKRGMDLHDFLDAMRQMQKMGPLENVLGLLPGVNRQAMQTAKGGERKARAADHPQRVPSVADRQGKRPAGE
jgi:signal recognition particle subunit SRP54